LRKADTIARAREEEVGRCCWPAATQGAATAMEGAATTMAPRGQSWVSDGEELRRVRGEGKDEDEDEDEGDGDGDGDGRRAEAKQDGDDDDDEGACGSGKWIGLVATEPIGTRWRQRF